MLNRRLACVLLPSLLLASCTSSPSETSEPAPQQFTRISSAPKPNPKTAPKPAPEAVPESETKTNAELSPEQQKTPAAEAPLTSPDTEGSSFQTQRREIDGPSSGLTIMEIRTGSHEGFDRVVYEFNDGAAAPGFTTRWVSAPVPHGENSPAPVGGDAFLRLEIRGTDSDSGRAYSLEQAAGNVADIYHPSSHAALGGATEYFIGLDRERPYRAFVLADPTRLVIDFQQ